MHPIREHILRQLILHSKRRFSELKPEDTESNHFMYYLKQLIGEGYVTKTDGRYCLNDEGKKYVGTISWESLQPRKQPKILTTPVCFRDGGKEVLVHRRLREPYYGRVTLVNGKLHYGESVDAAVDRELFEKTGLRAELKPVGITYLRFLRDGEAVNHTLSHIYVGHEPTGELKSNRNEPLWVPVDKVKDLDPLEGTLEILEHIGEPPFWFHEFTFDV